MNPPVRNILTVYIVCVSLAAFALIGLVGTILLIYAHNDAAAVSVVSGLTGTAVGSLASLLASTSGLRNGTATQSSEEIKQTTTTTQQQPTP